VSHAAYLVAGFESSGNRLLASILVRSGCAGEASTNQPPLDRLPPPERPLVVIAHEQPTAERLAAPHGQAVARWIAALNGRGYDPVRVLVIVREPVANIRSAIARGHWPQELCEAAYCRRTHDLAQNLSDSLAAGIVPEVLTYEGLTEPFLAAWLPRIGLRYVPGAIILPGQIAPPRIELQNEKWYPLSRR
jgi:hypothetical protein